MADDIRPRIRMPSRAAPGEVITLRVQATHPMEPGQRHDADGQLIPRMILNRFTCEFNGVNVIDLALDPAISANPYFEFDARVESSGAFRFVWYGDDGAVHEHEQKITVG